MFQLMLLVNNIQYYAIPSGTVLMFLDQEISYSVLCDPIMTLDDYYAE